MKIFGVDFTSAPRKAKAITVAHGFLGKNLLSIEKIERLESFDAFEALLRYPGPWIGGFDFPFGLPRELVRDLGWPRNWRRLVAFCAGLSRREWRGILDGYRATRPAGRKYAHRATDLPAGSSSPMKLVNPPVALMFHEGAPRIAEAGAHVPGLASGDRSRIALEAYPGLFARRILGSVSYKNDSKAKQTIGRLTARKKLLEKIPVETSEQIRRQLVDDASGDSLDAVICALQAAWGWQRRRRNFGLPARIEPCEGWIVSA
ncbi:MAG TPA: DUF429 domain-containing protein [Burkholderiales bacterium]|nr:DUF429 domain-containing protein [Burkholderiales bacterium]